MFVQRYSDYFLDVSLNHLSVSFSCENLIDSNHQLINSIIQMKKNNNVLIQLPHLTCKRFKGCKYSLMYLMLKHTTTLSLNTCTLCKYQRYDL